MIEKKIRFEISNISALEEKTKKAHALSEELARVLKEIEELEIKIQVCE